MPDDESHLTPHRAGQVNKPLPAPFTLWRRKTPEEYRQHLRRENFRRFNPVPPVIAGVVISVAFCGLKMLGGSNRRPTLPVDFGTAIKAMPCFLIFATVAAYLFQVLRGYLVTPQPLNICAKCHEIHVPGSVDRCPCGGYLEDIAHWVRT